MHLPCPSLSPVQWRVVSAPACEVSPSLQHCMVRTLSQEATGKCPNSLSFPQEEGHLQHWPARSLLHQTAQQHVFPSSLKLRRILTCFSRKLLDFLTTGCLFQLELDGSCCRELSHRARFQSGELEGSCCRELDGSCCRELFHRAGFQSVDMVTQRLEVIFYWLKSYLGETQENIGTCS